LPFLLILFSRKLTASPFRCSFFRAERWIFPGDEPRLLHVGRIAPEKNTEEVIRAFALIKRELPRARLTVVGDGPVLIDLKREASELGIADSVQFTGYLARKELPQIYAEHDLFITASAMETQGLVALEAIATGLPADEQALALVRAFAQYAVVVTYFIFCFISVKVKMLAVEVFHDCENRRENTADHVQQPDTKNIHKPEDLTVLALVAMDYDHMIVFPALADHVVAFVQVLFYFRGQTDDVAERIMVSDQIDLQRNGGGQRIDSVKKFVEAFAIELAYELALRTEVPVLDDVSHKKDFAESNTLLVQVIEQAEKILVPVGG
jgi:hypothetical protein